MTHSNFRHQVFALLFLVCVCPVAVVLAQEKVDVFGAPTLQETSEEFDLYEYACTKRVTIDFGSGSVVDFVEMITDQAPELNIMIRSDVQNIELPKLLLRNITADTALLSLGELSLDALDVQINDSNDYYVIGPNFNREKGSVEVLNVSEYLMDYETESISTSRQEQLLSAIEAGKLMLVSSSGAMKISLHPTTGLLFVKGNSEETGLVQRIVRELVGNPIINSGAGDK
jgi:hypothetical protein